MSIPPPPQHPPPRRQPQEPADPSLTTQIFLDQARTAVSGRAAAAGQGAGGSAGPGGPTDDAQTDDAQTQALTPQGIAEAQRLATESGAGADPGADPGADTSGESTRMLSMDELREIAASSRIEAIDGPREAPVPGERAPRASAQDEARAREQADPGVFSAAVPPPQVPAVAVPAPVPPPLAAPAPPSAPPPAHAFAHAQHPHTTYAGGAHYGTDLQGNEGRRAPQRRGMPVLAIVFVVLSGLIVLGIGGWIVVDMLSRSGDETQQTAPPPATQESTDEGGLVDEADDTGSPSATADVESFVTPSGNIGCTIDAERARCIVQSFDYDPPDAPDECTMDAWGSIVVANRDGAGFSCTPAPFPADAQTLDYGQDVSAHGMTCTSSETGVSCRSDESGAAFSVARASASFDQP